MATVGLWATAAQAQDAAPATPTALDAVTITLGQGQLRSVQGLVKPEFDTAISGASPLATVARLPGVNFQAADPLGNYEWSARIAVRAFAQSQIGFTLDDVPLGDMSYTNFNGLHISRAISSENVASALLSQGTGALDIASSSNLGGALQFYSANPKAKAGITLQESFGSNRHRRDYVRVDSGATPAGQMYLSYTGQEADKWKGVGQQRQTQWNLKYTGELGDHRLSAFLNTSKRREVDYQDMSLEMRNRLGYNWDNFYPDFGAAINASKTLCGNGPAVYVPQCDDAYFAGSGLRDDELGGVTLRSALTPQLNSKVTLYGHTHRGAGLWYTPYTPSPDGTPLSIRTTEYRINRSGVLASVDVQHAAHAIKLSAWREGNDFVQSRRFYATAPNVLSDPTQYPTDPFFTQWQYRFRLETSQFSVADTYSVSESLSMGGGFKSLRVSNDATLEAGTARPSGTIVAQNNFLPQLGVNWKLSKTDEVFATAARNMRAFQGTATGTTPFATTEAGFAAISNTLRPETADTLEAGWRTQNPQYQASVAVYHILFRDRLLGVQGGAGIQGNPTVLANVGSVRATGIEAALSMRLQPGWQWTTSVTQSTATYQDDVVSNGVALPTAGKHVVDAPDTIVKSSLNYESRQYFASIEADYMSQRYYSYLNDASVPGRILLNVSAGAKLKSLGALSDLSVKLGISNLTDQRYWATIDSNGFTNSDPGGTAQTLLPAAPRQVFVTLSARL